jgi:hypothetical protein
MREFTSKDLRGRLCGILAPGILVLVACTCVPTYTSTVTEAGTATATAPAGTAEDVVPGLADRVARGLGDRDIGAVAQAVHPTKGVRFSPYAYVCERDLVFGAALLDDLLTDRTRYLWGVYDGSGEPIELTFADYYDDFIYDQDFANAEQVGYDEAVGQGNTINNIGKFYPDAVFVEYHFSGFDPQYGGMDWVSLRLVFEQQEGVWYLVGVVHDEWTI